MKSFCMVRDCYATKPSINVSLQLLNSKHINGHQYHLPSALKVAAVIIRDLEVKIFDHGVIVQHIR